MDLYNMFSFQLSEWQLALQSINDGNHCLVTTPTGSGKRCPPSTPFAISHLNKGGLHRHSKRFQIKNTMIFVISSRNFFRDFDWDIKDNETADVLIMTTEILCNYLQL